MARGTIIYSDDPRGKRPNRYFLDGKEVKQAEYDAAFPSHPIKDIAPQVLMETSGAWPRLSDAWGVGAGQKTKAEEVYAKLGVPTEMVSDGAGGFSAKILNNEHQRKLLKATGMHNLDGGYNQAAG